MNQQHAPEPWYWEAEGENCPHGPEPDDIADPAGWDEWMDRHIWAPQDVRICLDAPAGIACPTCSTESGDMVLWADCAYRPVSAEGSGSAR